MYVCMYAYTHIHAHTQFSFLLMYAITLKNAALELATYSFSVGTVMGFLSTVCTQDQSQCIVVRAFSVLLFTV